MRAKLATLAIMPLLAGCGVAFGSHAAGGVYYEEGYYEYDRRAYDAGTFVRLRVPRGHLPPPGRCRIWLPGVSPGHQSPPRSCRSLAYRVPRGAWLLVRPYDQPEIVEIIVRDYRNPGIRYRYVFDVQTGRRYPGVYRSY